MIYKAPKKKELPELVTEFIEYGKKLRVEQYIEYLRQTVIVEIEKKEDSIYSMTACNRFGERLFSEKYKTSILLARRVIQYCGKRSIESIISKNKGG